VCDDMGGISCYDSHTAIILMLLLAGCSSCEFMAFTARMLFFLSGAQLRKVQNIYTHPAGPSKKDIVPYKYAGCYSSSHLIFLWRAEIATLSRSSLCDLLSRAICKLKRSPKHVFYFFILRKMLKGGNLAPSISI